MTNLFPRAAVRAVSFACLSSVLAASPAFAADLLPKKPFRAEMMITSGGTITPAQMYRDGDRMKMSLMDASGQVVTYILNGDTGYMLSEAGGRKIAVKVDVKGALDRMAFVPDTLGTKAERKRLHGLTFCRVYIQPDGKVCIDRHNIPLEYIGNDGTTMRVDSLDKGRLPRGTFDLPDGYTVFDTGGMMRGFGLGDGAVDISGITPEDFESEDAVLGLLDGLLGQQIAGMPDEVREAMPEINLGEIADVAATENPQAMLDYILGSQGIPAGTFEIGEDTTTAGVLDRMIGEELGEDWETIKRRGAGGDPEFEAAKRDMERIRGEVEAARARGEDGLEALGRASGMSGAEAAEGAKTMRDFMGAATGQGAAGAEAERIQREVMGQVGGVISGWDNCQARMEEIAKEAEREADANGGELTPARKQHYEDELGKVMACALGVDLSTIK